MRKLIAAGLLTLVAQSALGADLPQRSPPPFFEPTPVLTWTGLYVGGTVGGTWGDFGGGSNDKNLFCVPLNQNGSPCNSQAYTTAGHNVGSGNSSASVTGGAQLGYNYQINENFLVGGVIDVALFDRTSSVNRSLTLGAFPVTETTSFNQSNKSNWLSTVRMRLGFVSNDFLIYGTGGLAMGDLQSSSTSRVIQTDLTTMPSTVTPLAIGTGSTSGIAFGWTVGVGGEYRFAPQWSVGIEYLYYRLERSYTVATATLPPAPAANSTYNVKAKMDGNLLRAGINYHF
jgi:outer membrane immunogenic protein